MYAFQIAEGVDTVAAYNKIMRRVGIVVQHQITCVLSNTTEYERMLELNQDTQGNVK